MADLLFGGFALMPGPVRKEKQFRLSDDFSKSHFTLIFSRGRAIPRSCFRAFFWPSVYKRLTKAFNYFNDGMVQVSISSAKDK